MAVQAHLYAYPNNTTATGFPLCGSQDLMFDFNSQQNQHLQPLEHQQLYNERQRNQTMPVTVNPALLLANSNAYTATNNYNSNHLSTPNSHRFSLEFENQRGRGEGEVDHYIIRSQNERLRMMLQEQRKQQVAALLKKVETDAVRMLRERDEQILQAAKKRAELEEYLTRLEADNISWRRVAQENEAMVLSLHNTLEQMKERTCYRHNSSNSGTETEDAESCCDESRRKEGENRVPRRTVVCRSCNSGRSCVMLLPCRHLCSCKACEPFLQACPVCRMTKKSTIETLPF